MKAFLAKRRSTDIREVEIHSWKGSVVVSKLSPSITHKVETNHLKYCKTRQEAIEWIVDKAEQDISSALGVISRAEKVIDHFAEEIQNVISE